MENQQVQTPATPAPAAQPAVVEASLADLSLGDYRATREGKTPAKEGSAAKEPATQATPAAAGASTDEVDEALAANGTPEQQIEQGKKKLGGFQKTIQRQTTEIEDLKRQLAEKAAVKPAEATPVTPAAAAAAPAAAPEATFPTPKPKLEDCKDTEEYVERLADWKADERDWRKDQKTKADARAAEVQKVFDNWAAQKTAFQTEHDDYDAVLAGVNTIKLSPAHQQAFLESENGVALSYHLAQDPDELKAFAAMTPIKAAAYLGKLEAVLFPTKPEASETKEPKVSAAPRPFRPVAGTGSRVTPDPAKLSSAEYRKARQEGRIA